MTKEKDTAVVAQLREFATLVEDGSILDYKQVHNLLEVIAEAPMDEGGFDYALNWIQRDRAMRKEAERYRQTREQIIALGKDPDNLSECLCQEVGLFDYWFDEDGSLNFSLCRCGYKEQQRHRASCPCCDGVRCVYTCCDDSD